MGKIELKAKEKNFWILIGDKFAVFDNKNEAIGELKSELEKNENATIAEISYQESKDEDKMGSFDVNPISWREIAMGWIG